MLTNVLNIKNAEDGNRIKQGDQSIMRYELLDHNNDNLALNHKKAVIYLHNKEGVAYKETTTVNNNVVDVVIKKILPADYYTLEIVVDDKYIFPSDNKTKIEITRSVIGSNIADVQKENVFDEILRYGNENGLIQTGSQFEISKNEPEDKTKIWVIPKEDE
ncbi:hypothetical protein V5G65_12425 [Mammaliicoccus sciuri]|uniref:hypothetical protein n=1 Tax=Mammaliicoccus sciuri TaxID=1296 RepID=UPI0037BCCC50